MLQALASLACLPSRASGDTELDRDLYCVALEGVTRHGLSEAVKAIMRGALGHAFFPSPPELRMQCDKAMEHHVSMRDRIQRQEKVDRERIPARREPTPEERARVKAKYEAFCGSFKGPEPKPKFDWSSVNDRFDREAAE